MAAMSAACSLVADSVSSGCSMLRSPARRQQPDASAPVIQMWLGIGHPFRLAEGIRAVSAIADRYSRHADAFERKIIAVRTDQWANQSSCEAWSARDVVSHIVSMHGYMLRPVGRGFDAAPTVLDDPFGAFKAARADLQRVGSASTPMAGLT